MTGDPIHQSRDDCGLPDRGLHFLILALSLLVLSGVLVAGVTAMSTARAAAPDSCEPVEDVTLSYLPAEVYTDTQVLFTAQVLVGSLPVTYTWEFDDESPMIMGTTTTAVFTISHSFTTTGFYTVTLVTWNTCTGETPLTTTVTVSVEEKICITPTSLAVTYTPTQVYPTQHVLFAAEVATATPPLTYTWDFGDETIPVSGTTAGLHFSATHAFTMADVYTVSLATWNACSIAPAQEAITVTVAPCGELGNLGITYWPTESKVGEVLTFTAHVSGGPPPPETFHWSFGDGITGTGQVVTHAFPLDQLDLSYTVSMTASSVCSQQVTTTTLHLLPFARLFFLPLAAKGLEPPEGSNHLGYGSNIATADHTSYLADMGFDWAKGWVDWPGAGASAPYNFVNVDNQLREFLKYVPYVLLRIHGDSPPISQGELAAFRDFSQALAKHVADVWRPKGLKVIAYEIWNEPNLDYEWHGTPSAAHYTAALKAGYLGIKAGDPRAKVVSAGLATTGGGLNAGPAEIARVVAQAKQLYDAVQVVPDLTFLRQMYEHGAKEYCDAIGTHPYGGSYAPDTPREKVGIPIYFRRAEEQHQVMLEYGDSAPMWNTEFGWVVNTGCWLGEHEWMKVTEAQQAEYLAAAYAYADENWPWMGPMFFFNLDFATVPWYAECDPMRWYSITYRDGGGPIEFRQAFYSLKAMPKNSAW